MIIETMHECNPTFIEHINYIVRKEQEEKYPNKAVNLIILDYEYNDFKDYHRLDETQITFFLMSNSFLYRYIGKSATIQGEDLKRVYYVIF